MLVILIVIFPIVSLFLEILRIESKKWKTIHNALPDERSHSEPKKIPVSVNYHFTRRCNYECGFCFHTAKSSYEAPDQDAKEGLKMLKEAGMRKINFAGGEPFLKPKFLGELVRYCKEDLQIESVSIVSNGSLIKNQWFEKFGKHLDILAISCDSFDEAVNKRTGRGNGQHVSQMERIAAMCKKHEIGFKINSVITAYNWEEDMSANISKLNPKRWKIFQVLSLEGENNGAGAKRDVKPFLITSQQFDAFRSRHQHLPCLVPEDNSKMQNSYLILDEELRFLNCTNGGKEPSESILKVGVTNALDQSGFDANAFHERGGIYDWTRDSSKTESTPCELPPSLEW